MQYVELNGKNPLNFTIEGALFAARIHLIPQCDETFHPVPLLRGEKNKPLLHGDKTSAGE